MVIQLVLLSLLALPFASCQSDSSIPAMMLSNWFDSVLTWSTTRNTLNDEPFRPIGVSGFRISNNYEASGIKYDTVAIRMGKDVYDDPSLWDGHSVLLPNGVFQTTFTTYDEVELDFSLTAEVIFPPYVNHYVVRYNVSDTSGRAFELLSYLETDHPDSSQPTWGWYNSDGGMYMADETKTGGYYLSSGAFQAVDAFQLGEPGTSNDPLSQFASGGVAALGGNDVSNTGYVGIGLGAYGEGSGSFSFYRTLRVDYDAAVATSNAAAAESPDFWVQTAANETQRWLAAARAPEDATDFYWTSLLFLKHAQNPTIGTIVASFHPSYEYKVWTRDGLYAAMILDAAGYNAEAEFFFSWAANAELVWTSSGGYFHTCYDTWTGAALGFVEPQLDSAGLFPLALLHHLAVVDESALPAARAFVASTNVLGRVGNVEDYFRYNVGAENLAPADYSIWEESSSPETGEGLATGYFAYTQAMAWAGLVAAGRLRDELVGDSSSAAADNDRADALEDAIYANLWNGSVFVRQIWSDTLKADERLDSSSAALLWTGLVPESDSRYAEHAAALKANLTRDTWGLARYSGDIYFYASVFNPGGQETTADMPPWPVMTLFYSWTEDADSRQSRLDWAVDRAAYGGMPVGEAVDPTIDEFVWSSAPDIYEHAGIYVWTALIQAGLAPVPAPRALDARC
eukprot:gnl/Chilomastix_cuspidata/792.p1 GENE.gnl/Chilomastix_cuspidata/792~~gnl/Chilomastix_cuspidata/792.p1  ORF type:complete len:684 (-),score=279.36 gnl/Chilomastix_cuspidata/792:35-2086(-)